MIVKLKKVKAKEKISKRSQRRKIPYLKNKDKN